MTNKTSGTPSAAVSGVRQEMLESLTPSEGWGDSSLIRTPCHLWWPPWQTWGWVLWVAEVWHQLAEWPRPCGCCPGYAVPECEGLGDRPEPPWLSAWISLLRENGQPREPHVDKWVHNGLVHWAGLTLKATVAVTDTVWCEQVTCQVANGSRFPGNINWDALRFKFTVFFCCFFNQYYI